MERIYSLIGRSKYLGIIFVLPVVIGFIVFKLVPLICVFVLSFYDYSIFDDPTWIGLDNFKHLLLFDNLIIGSLRTTLKFLILRLPVNIVTIFFMAYFINNRNLLSKIGKLLILVPIIIPSIVNVLVWSMLLSPEFGMINNILRFIGAPRYEWFYSSETVLSTFVFIGVFENGFSILMLYSALQQIPTSLFEAIKLESNKFRHEVIHVIIPSVFPTLLFIIQLEIITTFQFFVPVYSITRGGPERASYLLIYYIYIEAFRRGNFGYACTLSLILLLLILVQLIIIQIILRRWRSFLYD